MSGVIGVMRDNIGRVMERGEKLEDLEEKSGKLNLYDLFVTGYIITVTFIEGLAESATHFRTSARRLERKMWWKNCKVSEPSSIYYL